jgi:hypothetical protein
LVVASEQEAWSKRQAWKAMSLTAIRAELVRVGGKNARLYNEASKRLLELENKIEQIRLIAVSERTPQEKVSHIAAKIDGIIGG